MASEAMSSLATRGAAAAASSAPTTSPLDHPGIAAAEHGYHADGSRALSNKSLKRAQSQRLGVLTDRSVGLIVAGPPLPDGKSDEPTILMIEARSGKWGFPKGHPNPGEDDCATALRETVEETSVQLDPSAVDLEAYVENKYSVIKARHPDCHSEPTYPLGEPEPSKGREQFVVHKTVRYFAARAGPAAARTAQPTPEAKSVCWIAASDVGKRLTHEDDRQIFNSLLKRGHLAGATRP
eukprot:m.22055 g.22055  ORF g.22055 m.22055 type:complete len:238 (-) comp5758_c0_seq1:1544-2257(-)